MTRYEAKLNAEKESNLGLKGQNGIMKKKYSSNSISSSFLSCR